MEQGESKYPSTFRCCDAHILDEYLQLHHSIELVGMKRVGINNFLRFYLAGKYQAKGTDTVYISVDLNDLIEREVFPFWRLLFKRIVDACEKYEIAMPIREQISKYFSDAIQSGDLFMTYDGIRASLVLLSTANIAPTIIFTRFDRLKDVVNPEFLDNLQGLYNASGRLLAYVFTSYRELEKVSPKVFSKRLLSGFSHKMYITPACLDDSYIIFDTLARQYNLSLDARIREKVVGLSGGHVQYLRLLLLVLHETVRDGGMEQLLRQINQDERVMLQSEELWESLEHGEQEILRKIYKRETPTGEEREKGKYLWDTGFVTSQGALFSELFTNYLNDIFARESVGSDAEFSKKEYMLISILKEQVGQITEREKIVEAVWPEYTDFGVSDWSIDRLVARVRNKLKKNKRVLSKLLPCERAGIS